jgi:hypothetical protein
MIVARHEVPGGMRKIAPSPYGRLKHFLIALVVVVVLGLPIDDPSG